jgi:hypothetical protein
VLFLWEQQERRFSIEAASGCAVVKKEMAALSGHNNLYANKLFLHRPPPEHGRANIFDLFARSGQTNIANYSNGKWDFTDKKHMVSVQDLVQFLQDQHFQGIPGRDGRDGISL